jgi:hypothetical protein
VNFCLVYLKILCYKSLTFFNKEKIKYKIFTLKFFIHIKFKFFTNLTLNLLLFKKGKKTLNLLDKISIINIIFEKFYWFDLLNTLLLYFTNKYHSRLKKKKKFPIPSTVQHLPWSIIFPFPSKGRWILLKQGSEILIWQFYRSNFTT